MNLITLTLLSFAAKRKMRYYKYSDGWALNRLSSKYTVWHYHNDKYILTGASRLTVTTGNLNLNYINTFDL